MRIYTGVAFIGLRLSPCFEILFLTFPFVFGTCQRVCGFHCKHFVVPAKFVVVAVVCWSFSCASFYVYALLQSRVQGLVACFRSMERFELTL